MARECNFREHDFDSGATSGTASPQISDIRCRRCGVRLNISLQFAGKSVRPSVNIYPATGSVTISRDMIRYFMAVWDGTVKELQGDGYQVANYSPTIHGTTVGV
jgi:hypothetical protein